jgi:hypothetical protein
MIHPLFTADQHASYRSRGITRLAVLCFFFSLGCIAIEGTRQAPQCSLHLIFWPPAFGRLLEPNLVSTCTSKWSSR